MFEWQRFFVFAIFAVVIGIVDFQSQKIPNVLLFILTGILLAADILGDFRSMPLRFMACLGAYGFFYAVYRLRGGLGFGDVKYAGVIGYYLGPYEVLNGLLCAVLLALAYCLLGRLIFHWEREKRFPFGPWLGCGAIAAGLFHWSVL